jgi:hypothetical protein
MFDDELKTIDKTIVSCANADILASAPGGHLNGSSLELSKPAGVAIGDFPRLADNRCEALSRPF